MKNIKKSIVILSLLAAIILVVMLITVFTHQKPIEPKIQNNDPVIPLQSNEYEIQKKLWSLVEYTDPGHPPIVGYNAHKNIFTLWYRKNISDEFMGIVVGTEKDGFRLVKEVPMPIETYGMSWIRFIDFNNDGLEDIYISTFTDQRSTHNDGFVIIQNKPGEFVLAEKQSKDLLKYTTSVGVYAEFKDVDGDGSIEIITTDLENFDAYYIRVFDEKTGEIIPPGKITGQIIRTIKLKGLQLYLLKEEYKKN